MVEKIRRVGRESSSIVTKENVSYFDSEPLQLSGSTPIRYRGGGRQSKVSKGGRPFERTGGRSLGSVVNQGPRHRGVSVGWGTTENDSVCRKICPLGTTVSDPECPGTEEFPNQTPTSEMSTNSFPPSVPSLRPSVGSLRLQVGRRRTDTCLLRPSSALRVRL